MGSELGLLMMASAKMMMMRNIRRSNAHTCTSYKHRVVGKQHIKTGNNGVDVVGTVCAAGNAAKDVGVSEWAEMKEEVADAYGADFERLGSSVRIGDGTFAFCRSIPMLGLSRDTCSNLLTVGENLGLSRHVRPVPPPAREAPMPTPYKGRLAPGWGV